MVHRLQSSQITVADRLRNCFDRSRTLMNADETKTSKLKNLRL